MMISIQDRYFKIDTEHSTYLFKVNPLNVLEHIYYGKRIPKESSYEFMEEGQGFGYGVEMKTEGYSMRPEHASLETSIKGRGDNREVMVQLDCHGDLISNFLYEGYEILSSFEIPGLPSANHKEETLMIRLKDSVKNLELRLYYSTYPGTDVITRSASLHNLSDKGIVIRRILSSQIDFHEDEFVLKTLDGTWAKERTVHARTLQHGVTKIDSKCGFSSAYHNPFLMLEKPDCSLKYGDCYGFNLIYSGNHVEYLERNNLHGVRFLQGINDDSFAWNLSAGDAFFTPEATLCYSPCGENGLAHEYHRFIREHIVRGYWQYKDHPVLINDWEALHFTFNEEKLLALAKRGQELGCEAFVLDDGWFGNRNGDNSSLGDWFANKEKLPHGVGGLADKIHEMGMLFGLWYEPEMVSRDSNVYRAHPEFALTHPDYEVLEGRHQLILDLANPKVVDYLISVIGDSIAESKADFIKWDCNRVFSDYLSPATSNQGETPHRYILGLYRLLDAITKRFPKVLFESCAAGGNRVDLGMLCFMPSFWCSDNTEPHERMRIQEGTLMGYPQSTIGAHVSACPNHQTLRSSQIEDRFNVACIGAFGYELDPNELTTVDTLSMMEQIAWYKKNRHLLAYGDYYLLSSFYSENPQQYVIVSPDQKEAVYFLGNPLFELNAPQVVAKPVGLDPNAMYHFEERQQNFDFEYIDGKRIPSTKKVEGKNLEDELKALTPLKSEKQVCDLSGESLMNAGVRLYYEWGSGGNWKRLMLDFGTRLYKISMK